MSVLSAIFAAVDARLAVGAIAGLQSYERMPSGDPAKFPALAVYDDGDQPEEGETGSTILTLTLGVQGYVQGYHGPDAHDAMTDLHAKAVKALCGDSGSNLGGLVINIEIVGRRRVEIAELASKRRLGFAQDFLVQYATAQGDPSQPA